LLLKKRALAEMVFTGITEWLGMSTSGQNLPLQAIKKRAAPLQEQHAFVFFGENVRFK